MSAIAPPTPRRSRSDHTPTARPLPARDAGAAPAALPYINPHGRGGVVMFQVPFRSAMSDADLAVLAHVLDLSTHMYPKMRPDPNSPGVARLDHFSGLFLSAVPTRASGGWKAAPGASRHPTPFTSGTCSPLRRRANSTRA